MPVDMAYIQFKDGPLASHPPVKCPPEWAQEWPPPEEIYAGIVNNGAVLLEATDTLSAGETGMPPEYVKAVQRYRRVQESQLSDEAAAHPNLSRGAAYELAPEKTVTGVDMVEELRVLLAAQDHAIDALTLARSKAQRLLYIAERRS